MKLTYFLLLGTCALTNVSVAHAQAQTRPGFEVGAQLFDYQYRERFEGETIVRDEGRLAGLTASYVETIGRGWFLRAATATGSGSVDYESEDGRLEDVKQDVAQVEFHLGRDIPTKGGATITAFTGIGGRSLEDNSGGEQTDSGALGYDREVGYTYLPLGLAASTSLGSRLKLQISGQVNWIVAGRARSKFSRIDPQMPDLSLDLDGGYGFEASAIISAPLGRRALRFGPFVRHWDVKRSKSQTLEEEGLEIEFFEPANRATELGLRVALAF